MNRFALMLTALFLVFGGFVSTAFGQEGSSLDEHISLDDVYDDMVIGHNEQDAASESEDQTDESAQISGDSTLDRPMDDVYDDLVIGHNEQDAASESEEQADESVQISGDSTLDRPIFLSIYGGGAWMKNHTRGNETRTESYGEFAGVSARTHVGDSNLGVPIRIELGLHVRGSFSRFKSRHTSKYAGDGGEIAGGVEAYFKHAPNGDFFPWWSMEIRLLYGYAKIRGKLSDNSYRATIKMNFVSLSGTFNILWPFKMSRRVADSRPEYRIIKIGGVQAGVCEGFFPKIELRWDWKIPTVVSKQSTATRQGLRDHAYERSFYGEVRLHFWKFVNDTTDTDVEALWEITFGPMGGLRWYQSNGRLTMTDGHSVYSYMYGAFITVTVNRTFGFEVVGFATLNTGGGEDVGGTLSLAAWW